MRYYSISESANIGLIMLEALMIIFDQIVSRLEDGQASGVTRCLFMFILYAI